MSTMHKKCRHTRTITDKASRNISLVVLQTCVPNITFAAMLSSPRGDARTARVCLVAVKCCVSQCIIAANTPHSHGNKVVVRNVSFLLRQSGNKSTKSKVSLSTIGCDSGALPPFNFLCHSQIVQVQINHTNAATVLLGTFLLFQDRLADWQLAVYMYICKCICIYIHTLKH